MKSTRKQKGNEKEMSDSNILEKVNLHWFNILNRQILYYFRYLKKTLKLKFISFINLLEFKK